MPIEGIPIQREIPTQEIEKRVAKPSTLYQEEIVERQRAVRTFQGGSLKITMELLDDQTNPIAFGEDWTIKVRFAEGVSRDKKIAEIEVEESDPNRGLITFGLPASVANDAGIYIATPGIFADERLIYQNELWIYNEPSIYASGSSGSALPTINKIRMSLRDSSPVESELLNEHQFSLEEMCLAAVQTVELWNATPPHTGSFTTKSFRYGYIWLTGIQVFLFSYFLEWLRKNRLPYQAGGVAVDDMNKLQEYTVIHHEKMQELIGLIIKQKNVNNLRGAFAKVG